MKKGLTLLAALLILFPLAPAGALVEQSPLLDTAFVMLEEGNPILERYNEITGANVEARYKYGLPYFFGGKNEIYLMKVWKAWETTHYFRAGEKYVYGFDCAGYINWIATQNGLPELDSLSNMILHWGKYGEKNHLPIKEVPYDELKDYLAVGDYLVGKHSGRHIMMYIGTLADYGYTAEDVPELRDYLDYPILINSGGNPFHYLWYLQYIEENGLNCNSTNGGVCIYIVGVPVDQVPHQIGDERQTYYYFDMEGYMLTVYDIFTCTSYVWFRP
ncbi:MAG: hypothetical protein JW811_07110 [Clostridiales bacterium]|nr:hypothetical protein [Clostridiales bacterium]